jgi:tRNA(Ile)-lysidine synthase
MNSSILPKIGVDSVMHLVREVQRFLAAAVDSSSIVVGVSGGADSVALLRALHGLRPEGLAVAHVNHCLRGSESDADEAFVRELSARLGLRCLVAHVDIAAAAAATGGNLEASARDARYQFLGEAAMQLGAGRIATGHTADDQAETVLHRLLRGAGLQGLRGMSSERPLESAGGVRLVRPMLTVTRAHVLEYLAALDQPFREDSSNADPRFTRNRMRRELMPLLKTFNPDVVATLGQLAEQAAEAFDLLEADAGRLLADVELPRAGDLLILDAVKLQAAHPYRIREALRLLWRREHLPISEMTAAHWSRLVGIVQGRLPAADFPDGVRVRRTGRVMQLGRSGA